jgi:hypothetical protein
LADRIFAALVGTVDGEGDKVLNDQLDVFFRPVGGRTARVDTAASAHPNAQAFTGHHEEQELPFGCGFLAGFVQVG